MKFSHSPERRQTMSLIMPKAQVICDSWKAMDFKLYNNNVYVQMLFFTATYPDF